jgi:hypothetical protein
VKLDWGVHAITVIPNVCMNGLLRLDTALIKFAAAKYKSLDSNAL